MRRLISTNFFWVLVVAVTVAGIFGGVYTGKYSLRHADFLASTVHAQSTEFGIINELREAGTAFSGGGSGQAGIPSDPREIIASIINILLTLVGTVLSILVLYAGYLWWSAGGDEDKVTQAKAILRNSIIGLAIVLASWGLTTLILAPFRLPAQLERSESSQNN